MVQYYNRLSDVLYSAWRRYTRLSPVLCLSILQPTIQSTDCPLRSIWRYYKRLSAALYCVSRYCNRLNTMSGVTTTGYSLCSTCRYYNRLSAALYCNRVSAVLYYVWRYYNWLSALLYLSRLQEEQMTCAQENFHDFYSRVSYTCRYTKRRSNLPTLRYDLYGDTTTNFLWCLTLSRGTTTD
jgi:cob(I)alamin adenosyltransferase